MIDIQKLARLQKIQSDLATIKSSFGEHIPEKAQQTIQDLEWLTFELGEAYIGLNMQQQTIADLVAKTKAACAEADTTTTPVDGGVEHFG